ncbi:helix-turn-helix domain-containing protein [Halorubellus sp. PRR65]|uniref:helix-turn-helix domain-containing protein n=1 Tax=Halorubellus sp. PRR65 TaxID=3098148 RepID=UPI002B25F2B5|nr:helix-turn-helix domain-containing protein [Halorubellus sp. PRR65]
MSDGIRAEIRVDGPTGCPATRVVDDTGTTAEDVTRAVSRDGERVVEEFLLADPVGVDVGGTDAADAETAGTDATDAETGGTDEESDGETADGPAGTDPDVTPRLVFDYGDHATYRFERDRDVACPCEVVEAHDCPTADVAIRTDGVHVTFHVPDMTALQALVADLREQFPSLDVKRLLRSTGDAGAHNLVFVDRSRLTERQLEVLETAHRMGYFQHPKGANAGEVATELDITRSTFSEHLAAAQSKLLDAILE